MQRFLFAAVAGLAVLAFACAETTCESHRRNSQAENAPLQWDITCNEREGYYDPPLQCTKQTTRQGKRWCSCYNKEEAITGPSTDRVRCDCPLKRDEMKGTEDCKLPKCARTGEFEPKQCNDCPQSPPSCYCVDRITGKNKTEPSTDPNLQCN